MTISENRFRALAIAKTCFSETFHMVLRNVSVRIVARVASGAACCDSDSRCISFCYILYSRQVRTILIFGVASYFSHGHSPQLAYETSDVA